MLLKCTNNVWNFDDIFVLFPNHMLKFCNFGQIILHNKIQETIIEDPMNALEINRRQEDQVKKLH
jgi:hypothetical protein